MKTAKEWAESVVVEPECDGIRWAARIEDPVARAWFESEGLIVDALDDAERARGIIERLVERVQADARAPLEEEIARLRAANRKLKRLVIEAIAQAENRDPSAVLADIARKPQS